MVEIIFDKEEDWENRTLCSNESCIGTIGPDGRCKECGKPYDGVLQTKTVTGSAQIAATDEKKPDIPAAKVSDDDDWDKRVLCSDGSCIGVIGTDGKCKECGKPDCN
jgi:hypothetical protein